MDTFIYIFRMTAFPDIQQTLFFCQYLRSRNVLNKIDF